MERTLEGTALTNLILEIFRLNGELLIAGNKITKPHGLTSARWQILGTIELAEQPLSVSQIARRMGLTRQGVQRIVNDLQQLGMVTLEPNIDHKRAHLISLTTECVVLMEKINTAQTLWVNQLAAGFSTGQIQSALNLLNTIKERSEQFEFDLTNQE